MSAFGAFRFTLSMSEFGAFRFTLSMSAFGVFRFTLSMSAFDAFRFTLSMPSRAPLADPGHILYSVLCGYYLVLAKFNEDAATPIVVKGLLIPTLVHVTYNTAITSLPEVISFTFPVFVAFIVAFDGLTIYRNRNP